MVYKKVVTSALLISTLAFALPVFAEEGGVRMDIKANIEAKRASTTERREDRREEIKNNIEQRRVSSTEHRLTIQANIAQRRVEHVKKVLLATIERLEKIIVRIESRITKIKGEGGNTTEAEGFVTLAKGNLSDAKLAIDAFANLDLTGDTAQDNFETIRAAAAEAKDLIRTAHRNLMMAVRSLKGPNTGSDE